TPTVDTAIRDALETELDALGPQALHARLKLVDPTTATRLAPADAQRVIRALSVFEATGRALSAWHAEDQPSEPRYRAHLIELDAPRAWLDPRIATRAHAMVEGGMIAETARLIADGVPDDAPGLSTLGYRAVVAYLAAGGEGDRGPLTEAIAAGHRKYAKRQRTWLRGIGKANITEEHGYTSIVPDENRLAVVRRALRLE
ncbi:MAG: tRNA dimethylallyltransferase, partial [Myxococcota bacterium]